MICGSNLGIVFLIAKNSHVLMIKGDVKTGSPFGLSIKSIPAAIGTVIAAANIPIRGK